jgi:hypothetical protein
MWYTPTGLTNARCGHYDLRVNDLKCQSFLQHGLYCPLVPLISELSDVIRDTIKDHHSQKSSSMQ